MLEIRQVSKYFEGLKALEKVSFMVNEKKITALIGPNGAGKTTLFNVLTGLYPVTSGQIFYRHQPLNNLKPFEINRKGISRTFQNLRLFPHMTMLENILVGAYSRTHYRFFDALFHTRRYELFEKKVLTYSIDLCERFKLKPHELAKNMPYGQQKRLEIARALASKPRLLLLDEPAAGMNPSEKNDLIGLIKELQESFQLTLLLIEHDMKLVMKISDAIVVLDHGEILAEGSPEVIRQNPKVIEAYFGKPTHA